MGDLSRILALKQRQVYPLAQVEFYAVKMNSAAEHVMLLSCEKAVQDSLVNTERFSCHAFSHWWAFGASVDSLGKFYREAIFCEVT